MKVTKKNSDIRARLSHEMNTSKALEIFKHMKNNEIERLWYERARKRREKVSTALSSIVRVIFFVSHERAWLSHEMKIHT